MTPSSRTPRIERILGAAAVATTAVTLAFGLVVAPPDEVQGQAQRLMYVHVPAATTSYLAFGVVLFCSLAYLVRRDLKWDRRARAAAELGVGLTALTIALGSIWGKPIWGVWWTWEPRLISTAVLLLVYLGYLGVRGLTAEPQLAARRSAAVGVLGFLNVPVVHFSVLWWRTLHQPPTVLRPGGPEGAIGGSMLAALLWGMVAFALGAAWLYARRLRSLAPVAAPGHPDSDAAQAEEAPSLVVIGRSS
jgi:heme exporter protein C